RNRAVVNFFNVGRADTADGNLNQQFVPADTGHGNGFDLKIVRATIHSGAHVFGNCEHAGVLIRKNLNGTKKIFSECRSANLNLTTPADKWPSLGKIDPGN